MRRYFGYNKIMITIGPKNFYLDLNKKIDNSLKYEIDSIISRNQFSAKQRKKTLFTNYCTNKSTE